MNQLQTDFIDNMVNEYTNGFKTLNEIKNKNKRVTIYGGAKLERSSKIYKDIVSIGSKLRHNGYQIVTGGGPGAMEAAFIGDDRTQENTIAYKITNIKDEKTGHPNDIEASFDMFSVRKYFLRQSDIFIVVPGGYGTLDELMELVDLVKTNKIEHKKILLYDANFWNDFIEWNRKTLLNGYGTISNEDLDLLQVVDSVEEVINKII